MCRDASLITLAGKVARDSQHHTRVGAVITRGSRVISVGCNKVKSHSKQLPYKKAGRLVKPRGKHAELSAILKATPEQLDGATIYVARILKDGSYGLARPCTACRKVISAAGIRRVFWTVNQVSNQGTEFDTTEV